MAFEKINYQPGDVLTAEQVNRLQDTVIKNEGNIDSHIMNEENPHNVTAEQVGARPDTWMPTAADVGAAPAGYGLGGGGKYVSLSELDNIKECGWYFVDPGEAQSMCGIWWRYGLCSVIGQGSHCTQELIPICSSLKLMRYCKIDETWSEWVLSSTYFSYSDGTLTITTGKNAGE